MSSLETSAKQNIDLPLEIAHLLLIDIVGYSKLLVNEQIEAVHQLNQVVKATECFRTAEANGKLVRVPLGDGMALVFFRSPEEPVQCALEIGEALRSHPHIQVRMGIHSGPVNEMTDVNDRANIVGSGINVAQRVMDCGDAGHILLSKHLADDLGQYRKWQPYLHDLGECEVKHGLRLHLVNFYNDRVGNSLRPETLRLRRKWKKTPVARPVVTSSLPQFGIVVAIILSAAAIVVSVLLFFHARPPTTHPLPVSNKSIAVLPFQNLSDEKENAFFAVGVQDEILTNLAKVADLKVISRTSVMEYTEAAHRNLREIARALGVSYILEGSVQCTHDRVRVSAQLIDAATDLHLWAEHYDRGIADIFAIESEVAERIVAQLKAKLSPDEKIAIEQPRTNDLAAHARYIRAKELSAPSVYNTTQWGENMLEAVRLLSEAVSLDPKFFAAYCELASLHDQIYLAGIDHTRERLALAEQAINAAIALRPDSGETHLALVDHLYCGYFDYPRARAELARARQSLPNEPRVFELAAYMDRREGRWDDSIRNLVAALELDPRNFNLLENLALTYGYLRRYVEEAATLDRALKIVPTDIGARLQLAMTELEAHANAKPLHDVVGQMLGQNPAVAPQLANQWLFLSLCERDYSAADRALDALTGNGWQEADFVYPRPWSQGVVARLSGDREGARIAFTAARAELEKTIQAQPEYGEPFSMLGMIEAALGDKENAIRHGERAVELLPLAKDAINGSWAIVHLAMVYAWVGETDKACDELLTAARIPGDLSYGALRLHPFWDPLRGNPRFEKIVASLATK